jgi:hypothetical protein
MHSGTFPLLPHLMQRRDVPLTLLGKVPDARGRPDDPSGPK